jgi:acyl carrier protein
MTDPALLSELTSIVRKAGKVAPTVAITPDSRLVEDLGIDSLDLVAVFLSVQDRYDVVIEDEDIPALKSISNVAAYVSRDPGSMAA